MQNKGLEERLMPPQCQLTQQPTEQESALILHEKKIKWGFSVFTVGFASPRVNEIAQ